MGEAEMVATANMICDVLANPGNAELREDVKLKVAALTGKFPIYSHLK
jgi:glycine/serine hydroxymethyltransferase